MKPQSWILLIVAFIAVMVTCNKAKPKTADFHFETLNAWGAIAPSIKLKVPDGYTAHAARPGIDFYVFYISPVDSASPDASKATLGVYVGNNPNRIFPEGPQINITDNDASRYTWTTWLKGRDSVVVSDVIVDTFFRAAANGSYKKGSESLKVHFFISATDRKIARDFIRSAESAELICKSN